MGARDNHDSSSLLSVSGLLDSSWAERPSEPTDTLEAKDTGRIHDPLMSEMLKAPSSAEGTIGMRPINGQLCDSRGPVIPNKLVRWRTGSRRNPVTSNGVLKLATASGPVGVDSRHRGTFCSLMDNHSTSLSLMTCPDETLPKVPWREAGVTGLERKPSSVNVVRADEESRADPPMSRIARNVDFPQTLT